MSLSTEKGRELAPRRGAENKCKKFKLFQYLVWKNVNHFMTENSGQGNVGMREYRG